MTMSQLFEGDFEGRCTKFEFGANKSGKPQVRATLTIVGGPKDGTTVSYDGKLDERNIKFTKQHVIALGWQGKDVRTMEADIVKANRTVPFRVRIASWTKDDGSVKQWLSADSIGFAAAPLSALDNDKIADANQWFADADKPAEDLPF